MNKKAAAIVGGILVVGLGLFGFTKLNIFISYPWLFKYPAVLSYSSPFGSVNTYEPKSWYAFGITYDADLPDPEPSNN